MSETINKLSLEQLAALNDEIIMLARAGVPIAAGLRQFAQSGNKAPNRAAERIAARLESGQSLVDSVRSEDGEFPDLYASVVESGVRAGRLPVALEAATEFAQEFAELRRSLFQAMLYPLITVMAAYGLFVVFLAHSINRITDYQDVIGQRTGWALGMLQWASSNLVVWAWIPPALLAVGMLVWSASGRASAFSMSGPSRLLMLLPGIPRMVRCFQHSMFARLASVLLENQVPLHTALPLAAGSCGRDLHRAAVAFAKADENGDRSAAESRETAGMKPLLRWILTNQQPGSQLARNLRTVARSYHDKGRVTLRWIRFVAPLFFMFFVGGGLTLVYAMSLFLPVSDMMKQLSKAAI